MVASVFKHVHTSQEAGQLLLERRQKQRTSLQEVSVALNIPIKHLQALEAGDFDAFSAIVYARGAYAKYAEWLGLDSKQAQRAVLRVLSDEHKEVSLRVYTPQKWIQRLLSPRLVMVIGGALIVSLVGGYIVWQLQSFWQLPQLALSAPDQVVIDSESVLLNGVSEKDAQVTVNGESILLRDDYSFELMLHLRPGINVVRAEAENAAGRVKVIERHLLRPRVPGIVK